MTRHLKALLAAASLLGAFAVQAQPVPADAPAGTTVQCGDGSYAAPMPAAAGASAAQMPAPASTKTAAPAGSAGKV